MMRLQTAGLHCEAGGFHIDPMRRVPLALITHAHSDHARKGSGRYLCAATSVGLLRHRLGPAASVTGVAWGEVLRLGETRVSFHPAGHILGSAQIRVEHRGDVWVVSGDYKREADPTCEPFEVVPCDTFVTEATFGLPRYRWGDAALRVGREIVDWWQENAARGQNSVLHCYALGKTQRVLGELLAHAPRPVLVWGEGAALTECYRAEGIRLAPTARLEDVPDGLTLAGELILAPHSIAKTPWWERLGRPETAFASGWMADGARGWPRREERGFVLSDHADWPALLRTARETGARRVLVLGGASGRRLARELAAQGREAAVFPEDRPVGGYLPVQESLFR